MRRLHPCSRIELSVVFHSAQRCFYGNLGISCHPSSRTRHSSMNPRPIQPGTHRPQDARRDREGPQRARARVRPGHRWPARQDRGEDQIHQPGAALAVGRHAPEGRGRSMSSPPCRRRCSAFESWSRTSAEERAELLFRARRSAARTQIRVLRVAGLRSQQELGRGRRRRRGDHRFLRILRARSVTAFANHHAYPTCPANAITLRYIPLGVGAVIPPWNFPAAIMAGMTPASIVCGNTVILKPSSDSPTIAAKFVEFLEEAGLPDGVVNFCPGAGATFGNALVAHPKTRYIAFTGSREVGLDINQRAAEAAPGQMWIKRTILEMGGKDAIIVDPMPTLIPPSKASLPPPSAFRARSAQPAPAPSWTSASMIRFLAAARKPAWRRSTSAIRPENPNIGRGDQRRLDELDSRLYRIRQERRPADHRRRPRRNCRRRLFHPAHRDRRHPAQITSSSRKRSSARCWRSSSRATSTTPWTSPTTPNSV